MTKLSVLQLSGLLLLAGLCVAALGSSRSDAPAPVLVELFTSEGCSSCPPADAQLRDLDRQPFAGTQLIVLSEHVDYWNHIGWADPYSSSFFSSRQNAYGSRFGLDSVYTPQMVVDGAVEFVGGDSRRAQQAIEKARDSDKIPIHISAVSWDATGRLQAHVEAGPLRESSSAGQAGVYFVVALDHAESQVLRGENQGRRLAHVAVVLNLTRIGAVGKDKSFTDDVRVKLDTRRDLSNLRAIAFVQESGPGQVLGAAQQRITR
jgi:hypothetical protein